MSWLTRMVTPPGGLVLDPFAGSATGGVACLEEGFRYVGMEYELRSWLIARDRLHYISPERITRSLWRTRAG